MCQHLSIELDRGCVLYAPSTNADATQSGTTHDEARPEEEQENVRDETANLAGYSPQRYWDAVAQEELPPDFTRAARNEELDFRKFGAWSNLRELGCDMRGAFAGQAA